MRFILSFILFGILFYLIWMFFPEAFQKLVGWAADIVNFFRDLFVKASHDSNTGKVAPETPQSVKSLFMLFY